MGIGPRRRTGIGVGGKTFRGQKSHLYKHRGSSMMVCLGKGGSVFLEGRVLVGYEEKEKATLVWESLISA